MFISLRTQFENLGDLLINCAAIDIASRYGSVIGSTFNVPQWYSELLAESGATFRPSGRAFALFDDSDRVMLLKPGGHGGVGNVRAAIRALAHVGYLGFARCAGFRIVQMPSSKGPSRAPFDIVERLRMQLVDKAWARDLESQDVLRALGARVGLCPDLAVHFHDVSSMFSSTVREARSRARAGVVLSFRGDRQAEDVDCVEVARIAVGGAPKVVVSQVLFDDEHNLVLSRRLGVRLVKYTGGSESIRSIREVYRHAEYVVSDRLHVLLMAALNGAIPVALISSKDDRKVLACMAQLGISNVVTHDGSGRLSFPPALLGFEAVQDALAEQKRVLRATQLIEERGRT